MKRTPPSIVAIALATVALITPAWGQVATEPDAAPAADGDWTVIPVNEGSGSAAVATFTNGISVMTRCRNDVLDVMITGLPPARAANGARSLVMYVGEGPLPEPYAWSIGSDPTVAFSRFPAMAARTLVQGGRLQIVVPPARRGQPRTRYVMQLDSSVAAVEQTLESCGRSLVDPRDKADGNGEDGLPAGITWARRPEPQFPPPVRGRLPSVGYAGLTCLVTAEGRPTDCLIESEQPAGYGLGKAVLDSLPRTRLAQTDEDRAAGRQLDGRMIFFMVNFQMR